MVSYNEKTDKVANHPIIGEIEPVEYIPKRGSIYYDLKDKIKKGVQKHGAIRIPVYNLSRNTISYYRGRLNDELKEKGIKVRVNKIGNTIYLYAEKI